MMNRFNKQRVRRWLAPLAALVMLLVSARSALAAEGSGFVADATALWVLVSAALVFFMQAGFLAFEVGMVRIKNAPVTALKNVADWMVVGLLFFLIGFGFMFGETQGGFIGTGFFGGSGIDTAVGGEGAATNLSWVFLLFQLAFCGTAMTIVSGAVAERTGLTAYLVFGAVMAVVIYPLFGHWAWGSVYLGQGNEGWLAKLGFRDFAGSAVVHGIGGWAALAAIQVIGPRMGRYSTDGKLTPLQSNGVHWSAMGTIMLWFCWWGFNGGSTLAFNGDVGKVILNTNLAGAAGALVGLLHGAIIHKRKLLEAKFLGATLAGLVAVTGCADVVSPLAAIAVGATAAIIHNHAMDWVTVKLKLDDVVGAVPVHGVAGVWGCLCVALFGDADALAHDRVTQLGIQALGCLVAFVWAYGLSWITFNALKYTVGVRVDPMKEIRGLTLDATEEDEAEEEALAAEEEDELLAQIREQFGERERFDQY